MPVGELLDKEILLELLSGKYGPVQYRYRYALSDPLLDDIDITTAVKGHTLEFNAERDVMRSGSIEIDYQLLSPLIVLAPPDFLKPDNIAERQIKIWWDILYQNEWYVFPVCNVKPDITAVRFTRLAGDAEYSSGIVDQIWTISIVDWTQNLMLNSALPYFVPAGTNYIEEIDAICTLAGIPLPVDIPTNSQTIPYDYTWQPNTPYLKIVNDLLAGLNYHEVTISNDGRITSSERTALYLRNIDYQIVIDGKRSNLTRNGMNWQQNLIRGYNQIMAQQNMITIDTPIWKVSQSPAMPLEQWITRTVDVDLAYDETTLQACADWEIYYERFHLQQITLESVTDLSLLHNGNPYGIVFLSNPALGDNFTWFGNGIWAEIGYRMDSKSAIMYRTLGPLLDQGSITHPTYVE